jgi:hypothetical protein
MAPHDVPWLARDFRAFLDIEVVISLVNPDNSL